MSNWTGTTLRASSFAYTVDLATDATRPELVLSGGVLRLTNTAVFNTVLRNTGGVIDDQGATYGGTYFLIVSGGLIAFSQTADSFSNNGLNSLSHGVGALNIPGNTGVVDFAGSDMYLGAVGARIYSNSSLTPGIGSTYRLGGGAPWNALGSASVGGSGGYLQISSASVITGANVVAIGDNNTYYNSGAGLFGNLSTVEFTGAQNFSGGLTVYGGTLQFTNSNQLGSTVTANSIVLDGGASNNGYNAILRYGPSTTTDLSARIGIVSGGTIDTGANTVVFATALANTITPLGTGGLNKIGSGTLTLSKANTYAGATSVSQGSLTLDFNQAGAAANDILNNATGFGFNGGTLTVNGVGGATANAQRLVATAVNAGGNTLTPSASAAFTGGSLNVGLGLLTRTSGSGLNITNGTNFTLGTNGNVTTTTQNTATSILGAWATVNGADWAVSGATQTTNVSWDGTTGGSTNVISFTGTAPANGAQVSFNGANVPSGLSVTQAYYVVNSTGAGGTFQVAASLGGAPLTLNDSGTNTAIFNTAGNITALGSYTASVAGTTAPGSTANVDFQATNTAAWTNQSINSLRFNTAATTPTVTIATSNTLTLSSGGVLVTSTVGNNATAITGGTLTTGGAELVVNQFNASNTLTINSILDANVNGLTKNGTGTLSVATATNLYPGQTVINGGILQMDAQARYGSTTGFTLNGGTFNWNTAGTALPKLFTLGINGGGINSIGGGNTAVGTAGDNLLFQGTGARTLNLTTGTSDRRTDIVFNIGDNGGPTSVVIGSLTGAANQSVVRLSGNNTYTGTTTITLGALELNSASALPGGLGGTTLTSTNTGGGNLIFNGGTGTNHAILGLSSSSGDFMRALGSGFDQVQFAGNGGFGNLISGTTRIVNLGAITNPGTTNPITWGSAFFFPSGGQLEFGHSNTNAPEAGAIDFQNSLTLGNVARIVDVQDNTQSAATSGLDAILSGNLTTSGAVGGLTKTGAGVLRLTGDNTTETNASSPTLVSAGYLIFANATNPLNSILGSGATNRTVTANTSSVVLAGATPGGTVDFQSLLNRLATASTGSALLDTSSFSTLASINMSAFGTLTLGAYSDQGGTPIYYGGTITPNGTTYRFGALTETSKGGQGVTATAVQRNINLLVLTNQNVLTGGNALASGAGALYLTNSNNFTGGTLHSGNQADLGFGNDSALGTGLLQIGNTTSFIGSLNGDHTISNNVKTNATGNFVVSGNVANDGIANPGAMTYVGSLNVTTSPSLFSRGNNAIFLGDIIPVSGTPTVTLNGGAGGGFSLLTTPAGAMNKSITAISLNSGTGIATTLVIDSDRSLGLVPGSAVTDLTFNAASALALQPGISSVTLNANRNFVVTAGAAFAINVPGGTPTISGVTTGGVIGNSTLTMPNIITTGGAGQFSKQGLGTLVLQGTNTFTATGGNGLQIFGGTLQLDYANLVGAGPILNSTTTQLTLGSSTNSTLSNGGTLYISNGTSTTPRTQNFFTTVTTAKDNFIQLDGTGAGGTITLGLGTGITRAVGGTLNFTGTQLGTAVVNSSAAAGILPGATWGGANLVATSGSALSQYSAYTALTGNTIVTDTSNVANVRVNNATSGNVTMAATGTIDINTLTMLDAAARTIDVRNGSTAGVLRFGAVGTILAGSGTGALTIGISGTAGTISAGTNAGGSGELIFINNSSNTMIVNSVIANNATGTTPLTTVVKSGSGVVTLAGANTYTGSTFVNSGVLQYSDASAAAKNLGSATVAATNIIMNGGALRYTGATTNTNIFGTTFNTVSAIDVPNAAATVTMGTTTTASGTTGIVGVPGILQKTGAGALTLGGSINNAGLSVEVVGGTLNLGKTSSATVHSVNNAANAGLIVDSGATAVITGTVGDQIQDDTSVLVKSGGVFNLNGNSEAIDGLAGSGTASVTSSINKTPSVQM